MLNFIGIDQTPIPSSRMINHRVATLVIARTLASLG
jgi:hypothetical protein